MTEQNNYDPKQTESKIKDFWEKEQIYKFPEKTKNIFSIDTPPPTISGKMHIGHAYSYSQQDFIARYKRMNQSVFYPFGTDDNGLPTERLVEKINNVRSKNMSRQEFIELCLKTLKQITPEFIQDWKSLGISADYNLHYSTIDKNSQKISQTSFIELFKKNEIYKKQFPTIWCPECQTAIAQAELEDKEESALFSTLKFQADGKDLLIATTRPELLPACVAVFINPSDKKHRGLIGKKAIVPLFNYEVPILSDKSADMQKGTGILMVCSYGDKFDVDAVNKHKLKPKIILNKDGKLNEKAGILKGLSIKEARKKILQDLEEKSLIKEQKQISHILNVHDKCGTETEFLATEQWFIKILDKKDKLIKQGEKISWHPEFMFKRYKNWIQGLEWDWSISRERHFGVPIPVWHCRKCNKIIIGEEKQLPIDPMQVKKLCPSCKQQAEPEKKVLDTWATSSLTPQIASSMANGKIKIPFSLRPQAHDIIRTWAFYTIAKSYLHKKEIPWHDIMISGFVTLEGKKMSKSKGNVVEPQAIIEKYGADALRYWASGSKLGEDLDYQEKDILTGKRFLTKLFNASKFVFVNLKKYKPKKTKLEETDRLFISELNRTIGESKKYFQNYEYSRAKALTEKFFWHYFCDNYLEIIKKRVYQGNKKEKESAFYTLYQTLLSILKMFSPITPFITEEIYQLYFRKNERDKSIHLSKWPEKINTKEKKDDEEILNLFLETLARIRQEKTRNQKSMKAEILLILEKQTIEKLKPFLEDFKNVINAIEIKEGSFKVEFV